jgi:hypothetical protein
MKAINFDSIIAMNLIGLGVLTIGYTGKTIVCDIPAMHSAIANSHKLKPMVEPIFNEELEAELARK